MQHQLKDSTDRMNRHSHVRMWLLSIAVLVYAMMLVGGLTRLTDSGLSITRWKPVTGVIPPLSESQWRDTFEAYKKDAHEYLAQNHGMNLNQFRSIYWWEWAHRLLGRIIGAVFLIPFVFFVARGWVGKKLLRSLIGLFALGALQGWIGWWMVTSGLGNQRIDVAPVRLMVHFALALLILGWCVTLWLDLGRSRPLGVGRSWAMPLACLVVAQMLCGVLTAGLDAGKVYTDWPLMDGFPVAREIWSMEPAARNLIENPATVQFMHRLCAYALTAGAICAALGHRHRADPGFGVLALLVAAQTVLGIATLISAAPLALGIAHQALGIAIAVWVLRCVWMSRKPQKNINH